MHTGSPIDGDPRAKPRSDPYTSAHIRIMLRDWQIDDKLYSGSVKGE